MDYNQLIKQLIVIILSIFAIGMVIGLIFVLYHLFNF